MRSSPKMLLVVLYPVIAGPSFPFFPLGLVRSDGCFLNLIFMVVLLLVDLFLRFFFRELACVLDPKFSMVFPFSMVLC